MENKVISIQEHLIWLKKLHSFCLKNSIDAQDRPVEEDVEVLICVENEDGTKIYLKPEEGETNQEFIYKHNKLGIIKEQEALDYIDRLIIHDSNIPAYKIFDPKKYHKLWLKDGRNEENKEIYDFNELKLKEFN